MAVTAHAYNKFQLNHLKGGTGGGQATVTADTFKVMLFNSGTYTWNATSQAHEFVSDFLAGSGAGAMTETTGTGYSRQSLTTVVYTQTGNVITMDCDNPAWPNATFSASYGVVYDDTTGGADSSKALVCYWDFGGLQSQPSPGTFGITISNTGIVTWTAT